jgi:hypothetical protein
MRMILPSATMRSPTAVQDKSDVRDENVYSALVVQHSGTGSQIVFTVPKGQAIPKLNGSATASTQAHHGNYSDLTTNLSKAGEFGSQLGDGSIRALGITIEQAAYTPGTSLQRATFGAGQFEMSDICSKCSFELKVGGKRQIIGPVFTFPSLGAVGGSIAGTGGSATPSLAKIDGQPRRLKVPIPVARNDVLEGVFTVGTGASLAFSLTTGEGQPSLVWFILHTTVKGDVR